MAGMIFETRSRNLKDANDTEKYAKCSRTEKTGKLCGKILSDRVVKSFTLQKAAQKG